MKTILLTLAITLTALTIQAQTKVTKDSTGNYVSVSSKIDSKDTGKTFTDSKGKVYQVYQSSTGKLFINRVSKAGNAYKQYLKLD